ncbi:Protein 60A [Eufriesea mexicana]|uniref:protein 60A-like n=1 Tax=Eufriesea mexicana TaxID=516756 RepID=UPI00083BAFCC|nr:PREDICTED: protein 60A-like [Eufriesea mexicana]OAD60178.1 Protein 60A [Eufriesea mexicana]
MHKIYFIKILFLIILFPANSERSSGLYIDNGFNQTIPHEITSNKQKRYIERNLLNILDLPYKSKSIVRRSLMVKRSAPKFLLNIYKNILSDSTHTSVQEEYENMEEFDLSGHDINIINQSDLIMTFGAHNPHSGNASKINRGKRIWFDVSEVPREENLIAAELRLYQSLDKGIKFKNAYTITIYMVARTKDGRRIKHYIDSSNTTIDKGGWITLNISRALDHWIKYPKENRGLFLAVHHIDYIGHTMRPDDVGIVGVLGIPDKQPFMVGFFKSSTNIRKHETLLFKQKRDIKFKKQRFNNMNIQSNPYTNSVQKKKKESVCNIKTLYISFKDLQWQDWIIAPEGYDAYYCSGECNFPLNIHMNATNHAIVQTLVHLMKPHEIPKPCCAPTKLSPISVLYFLDDSNVVLKKYKNMVINSCGCH